MTDFAQALVDTDGLGDFEGDDVLRIGIEIPGAAGGLREAMKFAPVVLHRGDEVIVALRCRVDKVRFDPIKDVEGAVARIQILDTSEAIFVDEDMLKAAFDAQREKIEAAKVAAEEAKGIQRLDMSGDSGGGGNSDEEEEAFVLARNHAAGTHAEDPMPGCPVCEQEGRLAPADATADLAPDGAGPAGEAEPGGGAPIPMKPRVRRAQP